MATLETIRKRLERWELDHLRQHCAELATRLECAEAEITRLKDEVGRAWDCADSWREDAMQLTEDLRDAGQTVGLTQSGHLVTMPGMDIDAVHAVREGGAA